jgi:IclR family transcriptional regulator, blcABC operon repressor
LNAVQPDEFLRRRTSEGCKGSLGCVGVALLIVPTGLRRFAVGTPFNAGGSAAGAPPVDLLRLSSTRKTALHATPSITRPGRAAAAPLVPAVTRALMLLDHLARQRGPMSLAQLTSELALPKSSVHGLCQTLTSFGYLRRGADGAFQIGPRVMSLAEAFVSGTGVAQEFNALWADAGGAPEETVVLSVLSGIDALYVAVRNSARPLGLAFNVGMRLPAALSGSGKAMLAFRPADEVRRMFAAGMPPLLTQKGPRDVDTLLKELQATARRGYSIDDETVRVGVYSFGAPVFDASGQAVAAVAVCINRALLGADRGERHRAATLAVARTLTERLGGSVAPVAAVAPAGRKRAATVRATR